MELLATAATVPSVASPYNIIESLGYIGAIIGFAITGYLGWRSKSKEAKGSSGVSPDVAAQVAAALGEREHREAMYELTLVIREQNRIQQVSNDSRGRLIDSMNRLSRKLEDST